jgi:DNA polymerase-3 subunit gamma/tau
MSYKVLALKYRPQSFDDVVGQETVTRTLRNTLKSGRVGHAFLLSGPRGVGKTTSARILARALNCAAQDGPTPDPCGECAPCREIVAGSSLDVQEIDGATHNSVDQVRELRESARYNPARDRFRIWIIDEVHMLSAGAFNALLKTLEEPPEKVKFIFATTEYHKLPETILSRCQQYDFRLIPSVELHAHLRKVADQEGIRVSDAALGLVARAAEGSVRDALSLFDQVLSFCGEEIADRDVASLLGLIDRELLAGVAAAVAEGDTAALLESVQRLSDHGVDYRHFNRELLRHFRELLLVRVAPEGSAVLRELRPEERERLLAVVQPLSEDDLLRILDVLTRNEVELRYAADARVTLEVALLRLAQSRRLQPFAELVARVERLAGGAPPAPTSRRAATPAPPRPAASPAARRPAPAPPPPEPKPEPAPPAAVAGVDDDAAALLAGIVEQARQRPSLAQSLRGARARLDDGVLVLEVAPDFAAVAESHREEYEQLARAAAGRRVSVRLEGGGRPGEASSNPGPELAKRERLLKEAEQEPAVQQTLELFGGRVIDVREDA